MKPLGPRKKDAVRRLALNETPVEIAEELGITIQTMRNWIKDPVFQSELYDLEARIEERLLDDPNRLDALEMMENASGDAAKLCIDTMNDEEKPIQLRMKSAWDLLDRTKGKPIQRQATVSMTLAELIMMAHDERSGKGKEEAVADLENVTPDEETKLLDEPESVEAEGEVQSNA